MDGIYTPSIWRIFDGKRKKWDGAREAIEKVNAELEAAKARAKNKKTQ
jgi:dimethylaniline monooxygenase (N-oxide forming)